MDFDDKILLEKYTLINEVVSVSDLTNKDIRKGILTIPINGTPIKFKITNAAHDVSRGATNWKLQGVPVDDVVGVKDQAGNDIVPGETKIYTIINDADKENTVLYKSTTGSDADRERIYNKWTSDSDINITASSSTSTRTPEKPEEKSDKEEDSMLHKLGQAAIDTVGKELNPLGDTSDIGQHDPLGQALSRGAGIVGDAGKKLLNTKIGGKKKDDTGFDPSKVLY